MLHVCMAVFSTAFLPKLLSKDNGIFESLAWGRLVWSKFRERGVILNQSLPLLQQCTCIQKKKTKKAVSPSPPINLC